MPQKIRDQMNGIVGFEDVDARVLDEMIASRKTRRYVAQRLTPTVAIANLPEVSGSARDDAWQKLMKELKGAGYSARFQDEDASSLNLAQPKSLRVASNGASSGQPGEAVNGDLRTANGSESNTKLKTKRPKRISQLATRNSLLR